MNLTSTRFDLKGSTDEFYDFSSTINNYVIDPLRTNSHKLRTADKFYEDKYLSDRPTDKFTFLLQLNCRYTTESKRP